ncbi:DUF6630 family protein [Chitinophaga vietnamensis]|uniref:DUF6630 family protein n=1 Tax=Chitinophaga vietnamensis TaxID=2593957 RepID=UPI00117740D1|nr:hypothetical protein [Chitinophaga vietnamensis]
MAHRSVNISREDFIWLTSTYGKDTGNSYYDTKEDVIHEIFRDKILIGTAFLSHASYELSFAGETLQIRKNRLDNYKLHEKARLIPDDMQEEDEDELMLRWHNLLRELRIREKLKGLGNAHDSLAQLYLDIFQEDEAEEQIALLPEVIRPDPSSIWEELSLALQNTGNLADFEWQELTDTGIYSLNELTPLQDAGAVLEVPSAEAYEDILAAPDFAKALLDFVNHQLVEYELKIVATGTAIDEYQAFTCLSMQDFRLANAMHKMEELGLVCFF